MSLELGMFAAAIRTINRMTDSELLMFSEKIVLFCNQIFLNNSLFLFSNKVSLNNRFYPVSKYSGQMSSCNVLWCCRVQSRPIFRISQESTTAFERRYPGWYFMRAKQLKIIIGNTFPR